MIDFHSANDDDSWGKATRYAERAGPRDDDRNTHRHAAHACYGCGSSFSSAEDLKTHLTEVHGAS